MGKIVVDRGLEQYTIEDKNGTFEFEGLQVISVKLSSSITSTLISNLIFEDFINFPNSSHSSVIIILGIS